MKSYKNKRKTRNKKKRKSIKSIKYKKGGANKITIIASLTTIPSRIDKLQEVINRILNQTITIDHVEINIPHIFERTKEEYIIPDWLNNMDKVKIYRTEDYGPATKVVPTFIRYKDNPNVYVWSCDDDYYYPNNMLSLFTDGANPSDEIKGYESSEFDKNYQFTNIANSTKYYVYCLQGYGTILYPPNIIKDDFIDYMNTCIKSNECVNDDVILGNYFVKHSINLVRSRPFLINLSSTSTEYGIDSNALHVIHSNYTDSNIKCIDFLKKNNIYYIDKFFSTIVEKNNFIGGSNTKAYVINLDNATDRMNSMSNQFKNTNITLERFPAVSNSIGWIGCGLSHIGLIKKAKSENMPYIIVLEDDCKLTDTFNSNWPIILNWLNANTDSWDIFVGGNSYYGNNPNEVSSIKLISKLENNIKLYKSNVQTAHFIIYNNKIYDSMILWETENINNLAIDLWANYKNMNSICCTPFIAIQEPGKSHIEERNVNYTDIFNRSETILNSINI